MCIHVLLSNKSIINSRLFPLLPLYPFAAMNKNKETIKLKSFAVLLRNRLRLAKYDANCQIKRNTRTSTHTHSQIESQQRPKAAIYFWHDHSTA